MFGIDGPIEFRRCLIAGVLGGQSAGCDYEGVQMSNSNVYLAPDGLDCFGPLIGKNGNFSQNPLFCDERNDDFRLRPESPCLPHGEFPGCGLIVVGCK
jgi:hypothetical protein